MISRATDCVGGWMAGLLPPAWHHGNDANPILDLSVAENAISSLTGSLIMMAKRRRDAAQRDRRQAHHQDEEADLRPRTRASGTSRPFRNNRNNSFRAIRQATGSRDGGWPRIVPPRPASLLALHPPGRPRRAKSRRAFPGQPMFQPATRPLRSGPQPVACALNTIQPHLRTDP